MTTKSQLRERVSTEQIAAAVESSQAAIIEGLRNDLAIEQEMTKDPLRANMALDDEWQAKYARLTEERDEALASRERLQFYTLVIERAYERPAVRFLYNVSVMEHYRLLPGDYKTEDDEPTLTVDDIGRILRGAKNALEEVNS